MGLPASQSPEALHSPEHRPRSLVLTPHFPILDPERYPVSSSPKLGGSGKLYVNNNKKMLKKPCILFFLSSHLKTQTHHAYMHMHTHIHTKKKSKRKNSAVERGYLLAEVYSDPKQFTLHTLPLTYGLNSPSSFL